ncbi:hypothetical protein N7445_000392 [Penicillium cf. griseofulvum]|nr:hypothetical protein N7445_000392 [Penicillium cf. griseofulvum]
MSRGRLRVFLVLVLVLIFARLLAPSVQRLYHLFRLPFIWPNSSAEAIISQQRDHFDVSFSSFPANYSTEDAGLTPLIPARLHHIYLGPNPPHAEWLAARADCLKQHGLWESFLWNDSNAPQFVEENFSHLYDMWTSYPYMVQRVDALRYMVLQKYGGAVLDIDLACKRSLEPLRQFSFVAPAAHPAGFSIGMMLASPNHPFVKSLVNSLPMFNHVWPLLSYVTIMFSTGCHYASTVYTLQKNRSDIRILSGTPDNPKMHMLNGFVDTPPFPPSWLFLVAQQRRSSNSYAQRYRAEDYLTCLSNGHWNLGPTVLVLPLGATSFFVTTRRRIQLTMSFPPAFV